MTDPDDRAIDLEKVAKAHERAKRALEDRRTELHAAVVESVTVHGMSKSKAARISGYTREYVAKLCQDGAA